MSPLPGRPFCPTAGRRDLTAPGYGQYRSNRPNLWCDKPLQEPNRRTIVGNALRGIPRSGKPRGSAVHGGRSVPRRWTAGTQFPEWHGGHSLQRPCPVTPCRERPLWRSLQSCVRLPSNSNSRTKALHLFARLCYATMYGYLNGIAPSPSPQHCRNYRQEMANRRAGNVVGRGAR